MATIDALYRYPVKGLSAEPLQSVMEAVKSVPYDQIPAQVS